MTSPNPDADLDDALGVTQLPPAQVTDDHIARAEGLAAAVVDHDLPSWVGLAAEAIADAEQRGAARVLAERAAGGVR